MKDNEVVPGRIYMLAPAGAKMAYRVRVLRPEPGRGLRWRVMYLDGLPGEKPLEEVCKSSALKMLPLT
jgi:hypothetical protein